jgi:hypothetical protein
MEIIHFYFFYYLTTIATRIKDFLPRSQLQYNFIFILTSVIIKNMRLNGLVIMVCDDPISLSWNCSCWVEIVHRLPKCQVKPRKSTNFYLHAMFMPCLLKLNFNYQFLNYKSKSVRNNYTLNGNNFGNKLLISKKFCFKLN